MGASERGRGGKVQSGLTRPHWEHQPLVIIVPHTVRGNRRCKTRGGAEKHHGNDAKVCQSMDGFSVTDYCHHNKSLSAGKRTFADDCKSRANQHPDLPSRIGSASVDKHIPGQMQHQQPVLFLDALGRRQQFHLDFIQSADALRAVIRDNFRRAGVGVGKIDRGEFVLHDKFRHADIDLNQTWEFSFRPGQTVEMSMLFASSEQGSSCPTCGEIATGKKADEQVECSRCGMMFSRIVELDADTPKRPVSQMLPLRPRLRPPMGASHRNTQDERGEREDIALFRRVRIAVVNEPNNISRRPTVGHAPASYDIWEFRTEVAGTRHTRREYYKKQVGLFRKRR
ncbi:hypothetical protein B0T18DRAFT_417065 [Schizothecium vesticola]|uniref:Ubiquitin-like domain-containing protein n=1 Tax=Schizothecium vesticola TaxID=314040 RepID=A0AA40BTB9_9PEZI|nr:hypothetical protein B0T18DRAFT_417065 [Schizothecium vesticola]